jgi:DNA-binding MarR family transcriptional regulator
MWCPKTLDKRCFGGLTFGDLFVLNDVFLYMRYAFGQQDCNLSYVHAFTTIAINAPTSLADLPKLLGISSTTITRLIAYLGQGNTDGGKTITGLNYVVAAEDPLDIRRKVVTLTPAGKLVAHNVLRLGRGQVTFNQLKEEQAKHALAASKRPPK